MAKISKILNVSQLRMLSGKLMMLLLILLTICVFSKSTKAETSIYVFGPDQSTVVKTGGFAGVHETYAVTGQFLLTVDSDAGVASFETVDAELTDDTGSEYGRSLDEIFNMAGLSGTIIYDTTIQFKDKTADGTESNVRLKLSFNDDTTHLTGKTTPPSNSADMFFYDIDAVATKKYAGGTGEPNDPYLIYTAEQMNTIGNEPVDWYKHFKLMDDIDLSPFKGADFNIIGYLRTWDNKAPFTGVFDGNNHTISNFTYVSHDSDRVGLFGYVWWAEIKNLGLIDPNVDAGTGRFVGSLVGWLGEGTISGCFVQGGTVTGGEDVGGLLGFSSGYGLGRLSNTIVNCHVTGNVIGIEHLGGLVGCNQGSTISACYSAGSVSGVGVAGGLVGDNEGAITDCYSSCSVDGDSAGGLVGSNILGALSMCYSTGTVSGNAQVGGLVGQNGALVHIRETLLFEGLIDNCYSTSRIKGKAVVGGLVGFNEVGTITHCYSTGAVSGDERAGGLIGENNDRVTYCFWDVETSGLTVSAGGLGKTTAQMQTTETFLSWGAYGSLWTIDEGHDYPHLAWENVPGEFISGPAYGGGVGTANDPYLIYTAEQLNMIGLYFSHWDKHFKLMADVDLSALDGKDGRAAFNVIGTDRWDPFTGVFDGNGHTISNLTLAGEDNLGMFGRLESRAEVRDLGVVDVNISGSGDFIGALAGYSDGDLTRCYSSGTVNGDWSVGGLVGTSWQCAITQCQSSCVVTGGDWIGGLVGTNHASELIQCYSTGAVSGGNRVGGLVGHNSGHVIHCYSTGAVSGSSSSSIGGLIGLDYDFNDFGYRDVSLSFWDIETSGQATSNGGTGKTTAEMQTADTFLLWGTCGNEGGWTIDEGNDYPRLWWEDKPGEPITVAASISGLLTGAGTEDSPYLVYTGDELNLIGLFPCDWDKHFKLMADVDLSGYSYDGALIARQTAFTGVFNGNGHTISHLTITGMSYLGLFGELASGAEVKDLGVVDVNISGSGDVAGGLLGHNQWSAVVARCYSTGTVNGNNNIGGLVGINSGHVTQCYSTIAVSGDYLVGGLLGTNEREGAVTNCYSTSTVSGRMTVGGLMGSNYGSVTTSYSTGTVSGGTRVGGLMGGNYYGDASVTSSFWDVETSWQSSSAEGTGKATAEMQVESTFTDAGWDFVDETANGTEDIWWILEGQDYPRLWWEVLE